MSCMKLNYQIIFKNLNLSKKFYPLVLTPKRLFCAKNDDPSNKSENLLDDSTSKKSEKLAKETPEEAKELREAVQTPDELRLAAKKKLMTKTPEDLRVAARKSLLNSVVPDKLKAAAKKKSAIDPSSDLRSAAKGKLMDMLRNLKEPTNVQDKPTRRLNLAKPVKRITKKERLEIMKEKEITPEKEMDMAVKKVASTFTKDTDQVESDLKQKLRSLYLSREKTLDQKTKLDDKVSENVMSSVKEVAATISESPIPARSVLANRLMRMSLDKKAEPEKKESMKSIIDKRKLEQESKMPAVAKKSMEQKKPFKSPSLPKIDLFGSTPLNIFNIESDAKSENSNEFWQKLQQKELNLLTQFAPSNGFEEMIMWTEQGKHWKFPIDNEIEMGAEENVGFNEHVFLERHLTGFPTQGPIRHFMELVCVGLSKNPYITVERKIENIDWFRNYFKEKEEILRHSGAII